MGPGIRIRNKLLAVLNDCWKATSLHCILVEASVPYHHFTVLEWGSQKNLMKDYIIHASWHHISCQSAIQTIVCVTSLSDTMDDIIRWDDCVGIGGLNFSKVFHTVNHETLVTVLDLIVSFKWWWDMVEIVRERISENRCISSDVIYVIDFSWLDSVRLNLLWCTFHTEFRKGPFRVHFFCVCTNMLQASRKGRGRRVRLQL